MSQAKLDFAPKWDNQVANQPSQMNHPMDFPGQIQVVLGQTQLSLGAHIKKYLLGSTLMRNH
jgi:flagellar motor switch/type III secretory pathway protein FliN